MLESKKKTDANRSSAVKRVQWMIILFLSLPLRKKKQAALLHNMISKHIVCRQRHLSEASQCQPGRKTKIQNRSASRNTQCSGVSSIPNEDGASTAGGMNFHTLSIYLFPLLLVFLSLFQTEIKKTPTTTTTTTENGLLPRSTRAAPNVGLNGVHCVNIFTTIVTLSRRFFRLLGIFFLCGFLIFSLHTFFILKEQKNIKTSHLHLEIYYSTIESSFRSLLSGKRESPNECSVGSESQTKVS